MGIAKAGHQEPSVEIDDRLGVDIARKGVSNKDDLAVLNQQHTRVGCIGAARPNRAVDIGRLGWGRLRRTGAQQDCGRDARRTAPDAHQVRDPSNRASFRAQALSACAAS